MLVTEMYYIIEFDLALTHVIKIVTILRRPQKFHYCNWSPLSWRVL